MTRIPLSAYLSSFCTYQCTKTRTASHTLYLKPTRRSVPSLLLYYVCVPVSRLTGSWVIISFYFLFLLHCLLNCLQALHLIILFVFCILFLVRHALVSIWSKPGRQQTQLFEFIRFSDTGNSSYKCCKWNVKLSTRVEHCCHGGMLTISEGVPVVPIWRLENSLCRCLNFVFNNRRRNGCDCLKHNYH